MYSNIRNGLQFLKYLSFLKLWNAVKLYLSFYVSKWFKKPIVLALPISIAIEPTTSCNLRCPECPSGLRSFTRDTGMLSPDFFKKFIEEVKSHIVYLTFYFQGEPYLNPAFLDLVKIANKAKIFTSTSTNAHYLNQSNAVKTVESGLDRLIISIDGTTQDVYEQYRIGGKLEKVLEGTKHILAAKKQLKSETPHVVFQFLVVKPNEHQIEDLYRLADEIGVDEVKLKTAQVYDYKNGNKLIPGIEKYSRYKENKEGIWELKNEMLNQCFRMWQSCVITWNGLVVPCCFDKDAKHQFGDLNQNNFKEVWNNNKYQQFRKSLLISRKEIDICQNCSEGTKVWA